MKKLEFFDFDQVLEMINKNIIKDSKTIIAVLKADIILNKGKIYGI